MIKLIDYIADSLEVPELVSQISEITVISNNVVRINNFQSILDYSEEKISVSLMQGRAVIEGDELSINVITEKFLQINGRILNISFEEMIV